MDIIEQSAAQQHFKRVKLVILEIGELASVEPEALHVGFDVVTRGTLAEGAKLQIERVPGAGWCLKCSRTIAMRTPLGECPECGSHQVQVTGGTDMRVKEMEVE